MSEGSARQSRVPAALTVAGSDSSGGAGLQADLKTFTALGVYGATVVTALTAQNTLGVSGVLPVPPSFIAAEFEAVLTDLNVRAVKTGMLGDKVTVEAVSDALSRLMDVPIVVDPVMVATSGDLLLAADAIDAVRSRLLPLARVITPNLHEAAQLLSASVAQSESEMQEQGRRLLALGPAAVLLKGGHGTGHEAVDVLVQPGRTTRFAAPRIETRNTHGTGCTLSAAIVANLVLGHELSEAVGRAKSFLTAALAAGRALEVGAGHGPVDHLHALRGSQRGL